MNLSQWFSDQLRASGDGFIWAIEQIPVDRRYLTPPRHPEDWPAARHLFHVYFYEKNVALPAMYHWLGAPLPDLTTFDASEEQLWSGGLNFTVEALLRQFREVRAEQIALLPRYTDVQWNDVREMVWGFVPLRWVVTKTYQHSCEHIHDVLRMALWWDLN
jgi:hypothetical protein